MSTTVFPAYAAVVFAAILALVLVLPFVAVQYRRRGGLTVGLVLLDLTVLLYLVALVTYTLLPLPVRTADFCTLHIVSPQLVPGRFVTDVLREATDRGGGVRSFLRNPALLQVVFNVALFVPLGMVARHLGRRSLLVTALLGLGVSLLVETTQITGDWFLYPCAYRLFDVDDLLANTLGAVLGALLAPLLRLVPGQVVRDPGDPRPVTVLRRLLGMLCDWASVTVGGIVVSFLYLVLVEDRSRVASGADTFFRVVLGPLLLATVQLVMVLVSGRTVGETAIRLAPRPPTRVPVRLVRWLVGIGGYAVLSTVQSPVAQIALGLLVLVSVVTVVTTRGHRGLAYVVCRWEVRDDRSPRGVQR